MKFNTLHEVIVTIENDMLNRKIEYVKDEKPEWMFHTLNYGETKRISFPITKNGKLLRKWYHTTIQRTESGYYELINYIN